VCCIALQCVVVCCSVLQRVAMSFICVYPKNCLARNFFSLHKTNCTTHCITHYNTLPSPHRCLFNTSKHTHTHLAKARYVCVCVCVCKYALLHVDVSDREILKCTLFHVHVSLCERRARRSVLQCGAVCCSVLLCMWKCVAACVAVCICVSVCIGACTLLYL